MRIPASTGPTVAPSGPSGSFQRIDARPDAFGAGVAQAGAGVARQLDRASEVAADQAMRYQVEQNKAVAADIEINVTKRLNELNYHPETGYLNSKGRAAMDGLDPAVQAAEKIRAEALESVQSPTVRQMLDPIVKRAVIANTGAMYRHARSENDKWQLNTNIDLADTIIQTGALNYSDEYAWGVTLGGLKAQAKTIAGLKGEDDNGRLLIEQKLTDKAYQARYQAWQLQDARGALASFQANQGKMSPALAVTLSHQLFAAAEPGLAAGINAAGGPAIPASSSVPAPAKPDEALPRGIRNNNPGNIVASATKWDGEIAGHDPRYASFETPEAGIRALSKNLLAYQDKHGLNTVEGIVARWAPATENDTAAYVKTVAKDLGVKPDQALNLADPKLLLGLTRAIIKHENGAVPYTDEQIAAGVAGATKASKAGSTATTSYAEVTPAQALTLKTGDPVVDALPEAQRLHVLNRARVMANQDQAGAREAMQYRVRDAMAMYEAGKAPPNAPSGTEIMRAYGQEQGVRVMEQLTAAQQFGADVQTVAAMPTSDQAALLARRAPQPGEGFEVAQKRHGELARAIDKVQQQRAQDPATFALQNAPGVMAAYQAMANAKPEARAAASQAYAAAALAEQARLEIAEPKILPKNYVDELTRRFYAPQAKEGEQGPADAASIVRGLSEQWGERFAPVVWKQLAKHIPPGAVVLAMGVKPEAELLISEALRMKPEQLKQGIKDPADFKDLQERVRGAFEPLQKTLAFQTGGQETYDNYADTADSLAIMLMHRGMKPKDAAAKAFESMAGFKYDFEDNWRVPKTVLGPSVTKENIRAGAAMARYDIAEKWELAIPVTPGAARPEDQAKQWRQTVQDNGFWVTSPGDGGLSLWVKSGLGAQPVLDARGQPVRRSWAELNGEGSGVRTAFGADVYGPGKRNLR